MSQVEKSFSIRGSNGSYFLNRHFFYISQFLRYKLYIAAFISFAPETGRVPNREHRFPKLPALNPAVPSPHQAPIF